MKKPNRKKTKGNGCFGKSSQSRNITATVLAKAQALVAYYNERRRTDKYEPKKVHPFYGSAFRIVEGYKYESDEDRKCDIEDVKEAYEITFKGKDGPYNDPIFGERYLQGGVKVGTTSWIFDGRRDARVTPYRGWAIMGRTFDVPGYDKVTFYMAFRPETQLGASAMSGDEIGPCESIKECKCYIDQEEERAYFEFLSDLAESGVRVYA